MNDVFYKCSEINRQKYFQYAIIISLLSQAILHLQKPDHSTIIPYTPYITMIVQILLIFFSLFFLRFKINRKSAYIEFMWFLLFILFIYSFLSSIWSEYPILVIKQSSVIFIPLLILGLLVWADLNPDRTFELVALLVAWLGTFLALIGIFLRFFGSIELTEVGRVQLMPIGSFIISQKVFGSPPFLRISSMLGNPNGLAIWLMVSLILTLFLLLAKKIRKIIGIILLISQLFAIVLTFSRAGIGSFLISSSLYYFLSTKKTKSRITYIVILILILGVLYYSINLSGIVKYNSERLSLDINFRDLVWRPLIVSINVKPFIGLGFGISTEAIIKSANIAILGGHNFHLQTIAELGLIGYSLLLVLWIIPIIVGLKKIRKFEGNKLKIFGAALAICISFFPHQLFETLLLRGNFFTLIWIYLLFLLVNPAWET